MAKIIHTTIHYFGFQNRLGARIRFTNYGSFKRTLYHSSTVRDRHFGMKKQQKMSRVNLSVRSRLPRQMN